MGPRSLKMRPYSVYMRRVKCLDVQVLCNQDEMAIKFTPKDWFRGKMYVSLHASECGVDGNGSKSTLLRLPIGNEAREHRCGILRAYEVTKDYQRIFISALIVLQNNANVQTQGDRLIKVGCIMSNTTWQADHQQQRTDDASTEDLPIALESSLEFTQLSLPNEGSLHINNTDSSLLPKITLQIIDLSQQHETNDVQIGQNLELQIIAEYSMLQQQQQRLDNIVLPPLPDIRATSLIASTKDNQNYVQLIDRRGCPIDATVFPAFERMRTASSNILRARFHAFKFAGSALVNFDVKIHFCKQRCSEENCLQHSSHFQRRRRRQTLPLEQRFRVQNPVYISTVADVLTPPEADFNRTQLQMELAKNQTGIPDIELPLNYNLHVRGPDMAGSNSLLYGERGILLIAGIDEQLHMDSFCINQSLLIALLIFWLMIQVALLFGCCVLIQKYKSLATLEEDRRKIHESLEYLESRRVHWADQGGYTL